MTTSRRVWSIVPVAVVATLLAAQPAGAGFLGLLAAARVGVRTGSIVLIE